MYAIQRRRRRPTSSYRGAVPTIIDLTYCTVCNSDIGTHVGLHIAETFAGAMTSTILVSAASRF